MTKEKQEELFAEETNVDDFLLVDEFQRRRSAVLIEQGELCVVLLDDPEIVRGQIKNQKGVVDPSDVLKMRQKENVDHVVFFVQFDVHRQIGIGVEFDPMDIDVRLVVFVKIAFRPALDQFHFLQRVIVDDLSVAVFNEHRFVLNGERFHRYAGERMDLQRRKSMKKKTSARLSSPERAERRETAAENNPTNVTFANTK